MTEAVAPISKKGQEGGWLALLSIGCLYFSQGLPIGLAFEAFPTFLRDVGTPLDVISWVPLAGLPWVFKFAWAPFVENHWATRFGRRKSWIIPTQFLMVIVLIVMAFTPFASTMSTALILMLVAASFLGATQDIATDGMAAERNRGSMISHVNALQVGAIMAGMLAGGPISMILADWIGYSNAILSQAFLLFVLILPVVFWREPKTENPEHVERARLNVFFRKKNAVRILLVGMSVPLGGTTIFNLTKLTLVDAGWSLMDVGLLAAAGSSIFVIAGCGLASLLIGRLALNRVLLIGLFLIITAGIGWVMAVLAVLDLSKETVWGLVVLGGIGIGLITVTIYTLQMHFAKKGNQPATDFTLFQSGLMFGEILISSIGTGVAAGFGYAVGFSFAVGCSMFAVTVVSLFWVSSSE